MYTSTLVQFTGVFLAPEVLVEPRPELKPSDLGQLRYSPNRARVVRSGST